MEGTAGRGLCIEVSAPSQEGKRAIWFVVDGNRLGGHEIDPCIPVIQDGTLRVVGGESTGPMFFETSEGVESISLVSGGLEVDLATFELPDVPGRRFAAASVPDSVIQVQQHGRGGSEFRPDGSMTAVPISCAH